MPECLIFEAADLLPGKWKHLLRSGRVHLFNPGLLKDGKKWLLAYRVVGADLVRRIGLCGLDQEFRVLPESQAPLSDGVQFHPSWGYSERATSWFADPRLYRFGQRLFLYWNTGWHDPQNHQFLQEIDHAGLNLIGRPRELLIRGKRKPIEKNWMLFGTERLYAIYSIAPHRLLSFSIKGDGDIEFEEGASTDWDQGELGAKNRGLRGSAPPQLVGDHYYGFCHFISGAPEGYRYGAAVYRFHSSWPFLPTGAPVRHLPLSNPFSSRARHERLNPAVAEVVYPCGAVYDEHRWVISYGINDEHCALACLTEAEVSRCLREVSIAL